MIVMFLGALLIVSGIVLVIVGYLSTESEWMLAGIVGAIMGAIGIFLLKQAGVDLADYLPEGY